MVSHIGLTTQMYYCTVFAANAELAQASFASPRSKVIAPNAMLPRLHIYQPCPRDLSLFDVFRQCISLLSKNTIFTVQVHVIQPHMRTSMSDDYKKQCCPFPYLTLSKYVHMYKVIHRSNHNSFTHQSFIEYAHPLQIILFLPTTRAEK